MTYKISFTSGGLFSRDAIKVAELYLTLHDWEETKKQIIDGNLLQARTRSSLTRTVHELLPRLKAMTESQLELLVNGSPQEQKQILWLAVCKQYPFVREFAVEVVREKYLHLDMVVTYQDFDIFFNTKAEWNPALEQITDSTRKKLRQVLFKMLVEADLLSTENLILPVMLSPLVADLIEQDDPVYFSCYPISDIDIRKLKKA